MSATATWSISAWARSRCPLPPSDSAAPAKFYLLSAPAHQAYPARHIRIGDAKRLDLGSQATSNERSIFQFIHAEGVRTCQLVVGMTQLAPGSVWNTMPCHVHDRRMEVYLYFDLAETARVFHFMGEPDETRHVVMKSEEAVLSPGWSIHSGRRHRQLCLHLGDGRRQCRLHRRRSCGDRRPEMSDFSAFSLAGKRIMVTGANTGIGQGIALSIAQGGWRRDRRRPLGDGRDGGHGRRRGRVVHASQLRSRRSCRRVEDASDAWASTARIDGLVNNAGIIRRADAVAFSEQDWDDVMDVNLKTLFFLCQAFGGKAYRGRARRAASSTSPRC